MCVAISHGRGLAPPQTAENRRAHFEVVDKALAASSPAAATLWRGPGLWFHTPQKLGRDIALRSRVFALPEKRSEFAEFPHGLAGVDQLGRKLQTFFHPGSQTGDHQTGCSIDQDKVPLCPSLRS